MRDKDGYIVIDDSPEGAIAASKDFQRVEEEYRRAGLIKDQYSNTPPTKHAQRRETIMRIQLFQSSSVKKLQDQVNEFLESNDIEVVDIQFSSDIHGYAVMIGYK